MCIDEDAVNPGFDRWKNVRAKAVADRDGLGSVHIKRPRYIGERGSLFAVDDADQIEELRQAALRYPSFLHRDVALRQEGQVIVRPKNLERFGGERCERRRPLETASAADQIARATAAVNDLPTS